MKLIRELILDGLLYYEIEIILKLSKLETHFILVKKNIIF